MTKFPPKQEVLYRRIDYLKEQARKHNLRKLRAYFGHQGVTFHCIANRFDIKSGNPKIEPCL